MINLLLDNLYTDIYIYTPDVYLSHTKKNIDVFVDNFNVYKKIK